MRSWRASLCARSRLPLGSSASNTRGSWTTPEGTIPDRDRGSTDYVAAGVVIAPTYLKWMLLFEEPNTRTVWLAKALPREWLGADAGALRGTMRFDSAGECADCPHGVFGVRDGTALRGNTAPDGRSASFDAADVRYVLPAPAGHWIQAQASGISYLSIRYQDPIALNDDFPYECAPGLRGWDGAADGYAPSMQSGPQCVDRCPAGAFCAAASRQTLPGGGADRMNRCRVIRRPRDTWTDLATSALIREFPRAVRRAPAPPRASRAP